MVGTLINKDREVTYYTIWFGGLQYKASVAITYTIENGHVISRTSYNFIEIISGNPPGAYIIDKLTGIIKSYRGE